MNTRKKLKTRKHKGGAALAPPPGPPLLTRQLSDNQVRALTTVLSQEDPANTDNQEYSLPESQDENNIEFQIPQASACCITRLQQRLDIINTKISTIHNDYCALIQKLANDVYIEYGINGHLSVEDIPPSPAKDVILSWIERSRYLLFGYQRLSVDDLKKALFVLLPQFDQQEQIYRFDEGSSVMNAIIKNYAYKMITSLFTTANITYAVMNYTMDGIHNDTYIYIRNLLSLMKCGSSLINTQLKVNWPHYFNNAYDPKVNYHHSGGNMIVMIAGMLCYLHDKNTRGETYVTDILGKIRKMFDDVLGEYKNAFYAWLTISMSDPGFKQNLYSCTENLSDLDFILFAPETYVNDIQNNELNLLSQLSAKIIRDILNASCSEPPDPCARALLPFHKRFDPEIWPAFKYCNMTQCAVGVHPGLEIIDDCNNHGYRQTSNKILEVPMYLNRLKQGYLPFVQLISQIPPEQIPPELHRIYASKYGECIDLSIGTLQSEFYQHKHENWDSGKYYTIETLLWELKKILSNPPDDKTAKRTIRMHFLEQINTTFVNILFKVIAYHIQEYNYTEEEKPIKLSELKVKLQNESYIAGISTVNMATSSADTLAATLGPRADAIRVASAIRDAAPRAAAIRDAAPRALTAARTVSTAEAAAARTASSEATATALAARDAANAGTNPAAANDTIAAAIATAAAANARMDDAMVTAAAATAITVSAFAYANAATMVTATNRESHKRLQKASYDDYLTKIG